MSELKRKVAALRRPALLVRAARTGITDYNRARDLPRLLPGGQEISPVRAVDGLIREELKLEMARTAADATYSVMRHIDVLIALMVETRGLTGPHALTD